MPTFKVAHVREQGVDLIIVPLDAQFGRQTPDQQIRDTGMLQVHANSAGLGGTVVPVWDSGNGRMAFRAPDKWHPFFRGSACLQSLRV